MHNLGLAPNLSNQSGALNTIAKGSTTQQLQILQVPQPQRVQPQYRDMIDLSAGNSRRVAEIPMENVIK